jgi:hypothetical protein
MTLMARSYPGRAVTGEQRIAVLQRALNDGKRVRITGGQAKAITRSFPLVTGTSRKAKVRKAR